MRRFWGSTLLSMVLAAGCGVAPTGQEGEPATITPGGVHMMPMHRPGETPAPAARPTEAQPEIAGLTYFGGPLLGTVNVVPVFWKSTTQFQSQLNSFYSAVVGSSLFDMITEYNTSGTTFTHGTKAASVVDPSPPSATTITDAQIQTELSRLIGAHTVPAPTANTLYMIHFPAGITINQGGSLSCQVFCAYHGTFVRSGVNIYYGVIPDQGGACAGGCGANPTLFNNLTSVSSHELIEAVTDPAVGLATTFGPPLGWYDQPDNQEIGDLCNAQQGTAAGFTVQKEWSNKQNGCFVAPAAGGGGGGGGGGGCAHAICSTGGALTSSCDPCASQICAQDSFCCTTSWDSICVGEVGSICGQTC